MKKIIWTIVLLVLLTVIPVRAQDEAQLAEKLSELEETAAKLQLIVSGADPVIDPAAVHKMNEAVPTTIGALQLTKAFVTIDGDLRLSFKLLNTTEEPVEFDTFGVVVRDANGLEMEGAWDCPNEFGGELVPGDVMQGNACVEFAGPLPIRVYYVIDGYMADIVTWEITE